MKIGFLVGSISFGGGERILLSLIENFKQHGHEILLYTYNKEWKNSHYARLYSVNILNNNPIGITGKIKAIKEFNITLKQTRPECVIVFNLALAEIAAISCKLTKTTIITSERVDPHYLPKSTIHRILKLITYTLCDGIIFQTTEVQHFFPKHIQKKGVVISNPIMDTLPPVNISSNFRKEIVAVGRLSKEKNWEMLLFAFSKIEKMADYKLIFYGDGPEKEKLTTLTHQLSIEKNVQFEGTVDSVYNKIHNADILVLTSNHEGMPNALIEGMAMGLLCISTNFKSGGAKALITHKKNGILIPTNDVKSLIYYINYYINNPMEKDAIKKEAIKIRNNLNKEKIISEWIKFIQSKIQNNL